MQEDGSGVFIRRQWLSESHISKILQRIRQRVIGRISDFPTSIALREFFRREGCQAEEVVGAVFNHIDAQVVPCIHPKIGTLSVAYEQPIQLELPIQGRVFNALDLRYVQHAPKRFVVEYFAIGCKS